MPRDHLCYAVWVSLHATIVAIPDIWMSDSERLRRFVEAVVYALRGGSGRDLYAFRSVQDSPAGAGRDVIEDFVPGQDVIDVGNLDADSALPGQQTFRWVGKATLTGAAQLGYHVAGGNTIVRASTDADADAEVEIQLNDTKVPTPADFRF